MPPRPCRQVVYEERFDRELKGIEPDAKRADEFMRGAEWVLVRKPSHGVQLSEDAPVWFISLDGVPSTVPVVAYYTFDEERVFFLSVRKVGFKWG